MRKRIIAAVLCSVLMLAGCGSADTASEEKSSIEPNIEQEVQSLNFSGLGDVKLLQYVEDSVGATIDNELDDDYRIESVSASYVSKEYLEELEYNSKENVYFGYTLSELDEQFQGERYVFTLDDDGKTKVEAFQAYDDTFNKAVQNIAIGTGVIFVAATVSVLTAGTSTAVSVVFAASAKSATSVALSSGVLGGAFEGAMTYIQTGDINDSLKAAASSGSEAFKWGAIGGVITGGASKALTYPKANPSIPTWRQSEQKALWKYGGKEQVAYLNGKEVEYNKSGATRPDVVRAVSGHKEAIEVKRCDIVNNSTRSQCIMKLEKQIKDRMINLPPPK
ncbi:hypothetical protein [Bifidobacterium lemurum]|uniref:hypothetical protein n=1 Tax=Bifidobacterium lemurum TaxID=1603886 RepID=UPI0018673976|nr:hypothetical protein [Bifidobacterium lemurum]QOL34037.1 hypothetical protein BL8807_09860 [Bifidobacterium lemurum]